MDSSSISSAAAAVWFAVSASAVISNAVRKLVLWLKSQYLSPTLALVVITTIIN